MAEATEEKQGVLPKVFFRQRRWLLIRLIINGFLQAASIVGSMLLVRYAFDALLNPTFDDPEVHMFEMTEVNDIWFFACGLLACTGLAAWLRWIQRVDAERLGQSYIHRIRLMLYDKMGRCAPRALGRRSSGSTILRFIGDLSAIRRWVSLGLARIVVASIIAIISLGFLAWLDIYLATVSILLLTFGLLWNLLLGPKMHQTISEARKRRGRLAANISEKIRSFTVIQAFDQVDRERRRYRNQSQKLRDAMISRARASGKMRVVTEGATAASLGLVLSLGALLVFKGITTSGNVVAAMAVVGFLSTPIRDLGRVHEYFQGAQVSREKILQFMRTRNLRGRDPDLPDLKIDKGLIEFREVTLEGALYGISASAPPGSRIAIIGPNGAGKSTLLHVINRLVDPDSGQVLVDGQELSRCNLASIRRMIGSVSPDLPLLRGSVRYNLCYRWRDAPEEEVTRVKKLCLLDEMINSFPQGEKHRIQEGGQNLSLGQRHRLALARAVLGNPSILILDEIDANLDPQATAVVDHVIESFPGTILMVTRAEERLGRADEVWHIRSGRLIKKEHLTTNREQVTTV
ncbi:MAG: ABC transporter ATP-binding protein [Desulfuromonas sp.]|nr:MAG: ABC transporter ATP-binding protein [Desulfuromonas sp.]